MPLGIVLCEVIPYNLIDSVSGPLSGILQPRNIQKWKLISTHLVNLPHKNLLHISTM